MKRRFIAIFGIALLTFTSCRAISSLLHDGEVVAEVSGTKLYRSDLDLVIPKGIDPADSAILAKQYINTWASEQVFLSIAEEQLSKSEKDVTQELDEYRKSLLKYRYEQLYVNERLDTSVSDERVEAYYNAHKETFILERPILKARLLVISEVSPVLDDIKKKMVSDDPVDLAEADSLAYFSATKFTTWDNEWIDAVVLSREFGMEYDKMMSSIRRDWIQTVDTTGVLSIAYVPSVIREGEYAPLEYCAPEIRDILLSSRKQRLISTLEQDLLNDALENGKFIIY